MSDLLDRLVIAAPCEVSWDSMEGDDRVRHCSGCSKNVYNISSMTDSEAESFLKENGASQCMRFFRRADGTIMTDNCPLGLRRLRDQYRKVSGLVAGLLATFFSFAAPTRAQDSKQLVPPPTPADSLRYAAGGPMIMAPAQPNKNPVPTQLLGKPAIRRNPTGTGPKTIILGPECVSPATPGTRATPKPELQTTPSMPEAISTPLNGDMAAFELWQNGRKAEADGKFTLALTYYQEALKVSQTQKNADPLFQKQISESLRFLKEHCFKTPPLYPN